MQLFDSNILIYSSKPAFAYLRPLLKAEDAYVSAISVVEVLGYPDLTEDDRHYHESFFATADVQPVSDSVIARTVEVRRLKRRMKLGDALIAATALEFDMTLMTNNEADFTGLAGLRVENPLKPSP